MDTHENENELSVTLLSKLATRVLMESYRFVGFFNRYDLFTGFVMSVLII